MRQRYAYGSNIAAVRCGWDIKIKEQWRIKNSRIQSAAALRMRALFLVIRRCDFSRIPFVIARGFSLVAINRVKRSETFDCFANARNDTRTCHCERAARAWQSTGKNPKENPNTFDCFEQALAMTHEHLSLKRNKNCLILGIIVTIGE